MAGLLTAGLTGAWGHSAWAAKAPEQGGGPDPLAAFVAGKVAQGAGDWTAAADFLALSLKSDPDDLTLLRRAVLINVGLGRTKVALPLAKRLVAAKDGNPVALTLLAADAVAAGDEPGALHAIDALPQDGLGTFMRPLVTAWVKARKGDWAAAKAALEPLEAQQSFRAMAALHAALIEDLAGHEDAARSWYAQASDGGQVLRVAMLRANFEMRMGHADLAQAAVAAILQADPKGPMGDAARALLSRPHPGRMVANATEGLAEALFDVAAAINQEKVAEVALLYSRLALHLDPSLAPARMLAGETLTEMNRDQEAAAEYAAVVADLGMKTGEKADAGLLWAARLRQADALARLNKTQEAAGILRAMASERPDRSDALVRLGDLLRADHKLPEALTAYNQAIERLGGRPNGGDWFLYYARATVQDQMGHWPEAESDLLRALQLQPNQPGVLNYLGYAWSEKGVKLDQARQLLEQAVKLRPNDGAIIDSLGWAKYRAGDIPGAVDLLERAAELKSRDPAINDHLGDAYWATGRRLEAHYQWQRAARENPDDSLKAALDEKLKRDPAAPQ
ncbi:Flp pilus assembly protein TadD [Nitrospirillum amazonense]|uniref:Flp pilus assembly protein TadD n=1 Tax=Nitrospirillum amazonense TaxID=28077 RepID=A0A560JQF7_9PROT|nr:tetratricopeptide repeat protein [Nitrospirillum amazonense]TWB73363.1 Flp pilus assembly protein TadD [Nitrospirillum amazonense]